MKYLRFFRFLSCLSLIPSASFPALAAGTNQIMNWIQRSSPTNGSLNAVAYGNGKLVVVSDRSSVSLTSPDGAN